MEDLKKEAIKNFVRKNFFEKESEKTKLSKAQKNIVNDLLQKSIGPNEDGITLLLRDNEGCLKIDEKGNIFGPS